MEPCSLYVKKSFSYAKVRYLLHEFIPALPYPCKGLIFYSLQNQKRHHLPFLYLFPNRQDILRANRLYHQEYREQQQQELETQRSQPVNSTDLKKETVDIPKKSVSYLENPSTEKKIDHEWIDKNWKLLDPSHQEQTFTFSLQTTNQPDVCELYLRVESEMVCYGYAHIPSLRLSRQIATWYKECVKDDTQDSSNAILIDCSYSSQFHKWKPITLSTRSECHEVTDIYHYLQEKIKS